MEIKFTSEDWARIKETYGKWWDKTLDRPIIKATLKGDSGYTGNTPLLTQATCHRLDIPAKEVVERIHYELCAEEYLGDAFPRFSLECFGPGVVSAFLGARLDNSSGGVWFFPEQELELKDMHFEYKKGNVWVERIKDIYRAGEKKWKGNVLMGMTDLGGVYDVLAELRGVENLMFDLYDEPDEVKRVSGEIREAWLAFYEDLRSAQSLNPGYSDWSGLYCEEPSYIIQNDFSYSISPDMFGEFIRPDLVELTKALKHTCYHMDGKGELPHLPQLVTIEDLDAIQWQPGDGVAPPREWLDVYREIRKSGKNIYVVGCMNDFDVIANDIGSKGLYFHMDDRIENKAEVVRFLKKYGIN